MVEETVSLTADDSKLINLKTILFVEAFLLTTLNPDDMIKKIITSTFFNKTEKLIEMVFLLIFLFTLVVMI